MPLDLRSRRKEEEEGTEENFSEERLPILGT